MAFIGKLLRSVRVGDAKLAVRDPRFATAARLEVTSSAFGDGEPMGAAFGGMKAAFPPLCWSAAPEGAQTFALIVQDIDVPLPSPLVHAVVYNVPATLGALDAGAIPTAPAKTAPPEPIVMGSGLTGTAYAPPTPIPGHGPHRYVYQVFALDNAPEFASPPSMSELKTAMAGHVLACGSVTGTFENA